jgi:hypothetical protein
VAPQASSARPARQTKGIERESSFRICHQQIHRSAKFNIGRRVGWRPATAAAPADARASTATTTFVSFRITKSIS